MSDWHSENERQTSSERFQEIMKSDLGAFTADVSRAFAAEKGRPFILGDIFLEILLRPVPRIILSIAALFLLWLLL